MDGNKWLNVPYDSGITLVRDAATLCSAMSVKAAYLPGDNVREPYDYTPECSRRLRAAEIWAALACLGRDGLAELVETCCRHATMMAEGLIESGFEVLKKVNLNQVMVSFGDAKRTRQIITALHQDGTAWCGGTEWHGRAAMRISFSSHATRDDDVHRTLDAIIRLARSNS